MVGKEAWNSLMEGKKVRYILWPENKYIYFDKSEYKIKNSYGIETIFYVSDIEEDAWEVYEEPKKVIKIFISQPMNGRFKYEIIDERNKIKKLIEAKYGKGYQIEYLNEDSSERPKDWTRIQHLGYSIMNMYDADVVVFAPLWGRANGCLVEHSVAILYEKNILYCSIGFDTLDE